MDQPYIVSARKYRPSTFRSVVGQKALTTTLRNAIDSKRLAQAYLFCGPRGVGKTSCARIFAKTINCLNKTPEGEACNECESCRAFNEGRSLNIVELDAASNNSVDDIRSLADQVLVPPQLGDYRVFIIDEVHMLSLQAFNAFLKTLEEPPKYVVFILATTEKHKVIPTILSRCQIYDFNRITVADMVEHLQYVAGQEGIEAEPAALGVIARKADGAMRDALSIFDQVAASSLGHITYRSAIDNLNVLDYDYYFRLVDALLQADVPQSLLIYKEVRDAGFDSQFFINGLGAHLRDLMVAADPRTLPLLEVSDDVAERYGRQASGIKFPWFHAAMEYVNFCDLNYRNSSGKQLLVELTLMRIASLNNTAYTTVDASKPQPVAPAASASSAPTHTAAQAIQRATSGSTPAAPATPAAAPTPTKTTPAKTVVHATTQPHTAHPAAAPRKTLRINNSHPDVAKTATQPNDAHPGADAASPSSGRPFTAEDLLRAWESFRQKNPELKILIQAMRNCRPEPSADSLAYNVTLDNLVQKQEMENHIAPLLAFLRNEVGNSGLTLKLNIAAPDAAPRILTKPQALEKIIKSNPIIGDILSEFDTMIER